MNKKIIEFANLRGFNYDKKCIYGNWNGYQVCVHFGGMTSTIGTVAVFVHFGEKLNEFVGFMETRKSALKILNMQVSANGFSCGFYLWTVKSALATAENLLNVMTEKIKEMGLEENLCPYCNQPLDTPVLVTSGGLNFYAHEACFNQKLEEVKSIETTEAEKPNNYAKGFLGAFAGAFVGGIIFCILFWFGWVASISSLIGAICGAALYSKLGGKNNKWKIVIVSLTTLFFTVAPFFLCYIIDVARMMKDLGFTGNPATFLFDWLNLTKNFVPLFGGILSPPLFFTSSASSTLSP